MALALRLIGPGEWTLHRDNVESGKVQRTRQSVLFVLFDRKRALTTLEKEEFDKLARQLMMSSHSVAQPKRLKAA